MRAFAPTPAPAPAVSTTAGFFFDAGARTVFEFEYPFPSLPVESIDEQECEEEGERGEECCGKDSGELGVRPIC